MKPHDLEELYMTRCLMLARNGAGAVSPNPMVGAVIVKRGRIIGEGFHRVFGGPHAEVNALRACTVSPRGATLYVNLEPCNHQGKTPPCADLIIRSGIAEVVIGMKDPNPLVAGKGIRALRRAGIRVRAGILGRECARLNESFAKHITTGLPFVTLKIAQTFDGKIADLQGNSKWITNEESRRAVHRLRAAADAVFVGAGTVAADNPALTVRSVKGRDPIRVVLDTHLTTNPRSKLYSRRRKSRTILICSHRALRRESKKIGLLLKKGVDIYAFSADRSGMIPLRDVLPVLGSLGITSLLVEGGAMTFSSFLRERVADKLILFAAPKILGRGIEAFSGLVPRKLGRENKLYDVAVRTYGNDLCIEAYIQS
jgi:diaminohydroxyphosphoribosylaminopyrimidine deaminase/5-amino-6-(5-phosphoribosylamino)uracil reductase